MSLSQKAGLVKETVDKERVTTLLFTPYVWNNILKSEWTNSRTIKALSSGEYLQPYTSEKLMNIFDDVWNLYGTIETGIFSMINKLTLDNISSLGNPINDRSFILADQNLVPVPAGKAGEILIGSKQTASVDNPIKYFRTGDVARYNSKGDIEFLSKVEQRIRIKGFQFEARDVEKLLLESPLVKDALLIQQNTKDIETHYIGYINLNETENAVDTKEISRNLRRFLLKRVPAYMVPGSFVIIKDFPVNKKGRLNYSALPIPEKFEINTDDYVAPKNETEKKLAEIFEELLKASRVSVKDSFFDLGGQSLLAVRLFNRIEEEFGQRFPLATLFKAPTIEELAGRLTGEIDDESGWVSLVPIQTGGSQRPLYLVHGAGGNVLLYKALAKQLGTDYPLYGLQSRGLDGITEPLKTVEEMAEHYLEEIRRVQPSGPYYLGGYCLGGTIAYEMAQRLLNMGERVGLLAMLDTYNFIKAEKVSFTKFMTEKFKFHLRNFTHLNPSEMFGYLKEKKRLAGDGGWANIKTEMPGTTLDDSFGRAESGIELTVQTINDHAGDIYIPKPYKGRLTLFKPQKNYSFYPDPKMGWGDLAKDLDIIELPVNPHAMLVEPYVRTLAKEIKNRISEIVQE